MSTLSTLSTDEVLTTTRSVKRRLDLTRRVDPALITECIITAQQAPSASNLQLAHFVVVTDPGKRAALGDLWRRGGEAYKPMPFSIYQTPYDAEREAGRAKAITAFEHLMEHIDQVPVHVVPCIAFRPPRDTADGGSTFFDASIWASVLPMAWSFMLAARARGLVSSLTTIHLQYEQEAAQILGIPYPDVMQAGLIPLAHPLGSGFRPAYRVPTETITHWDTW